MAFFITLLLLLVGGASPAVNQSSHLTERFCADWGQAGGEVVSLLEGESGWLFCPLFSHPSVYNLTSAQNHGQNLFWFHQPDGELLGLEQPVAPSWRISKDRERLWLLEAQRNDSGLYICMLRNRTSCSKMSLRLSVLARPSPSSPCVSASPPASVFIPLQLGHTLPCPRLQDIANMANGAPNVTWFHLNRAQSRCRQFPWWDDDRQQVDFSLRFFSMLDSYQGVYFCTIGFRRGRHTLHFTQSVNVSAVYSPFLPKEPIIMYPVEGERIAATTDSDLHLVCSALFPVILESPWTEIWWTVDGTTLDRLPDRHRFSENIRFWFSSSSN